MNQGGKSRIILRLVALLLLTAALGVLTLSDFNGQEVGAAACCQDCSASEDACFQQAEADCNDDPDCENAHVTACRQSVFSCYSHCEYCVDNGEPNERYCHAYWDCGGAYCVWRIHCHNP